MLAVQKYLSEGKNIADLVAEFGIRVTTHPNLPLQILNYDQIESKPKTHPVVRECRALVLHAETKEVVVKSFDRFFNWGEVADEMKDFDFSDFIVQSKEDGSLALLYYFDGQWHANTRGSFATDLMQFQTITWREGMCKAMGVADLQDVDNFLDRSVAYVCEFCSLWNKIVRRYEKPVMYLLTAFIGEDEVHYAKVDKWQHPLFQMPTLYHFTSVEEVQAFLQQQAASDPTFEGVVIRDGMNRRWKIKSATYLGLHKLRGEGDNVWNPKHLLPFIMAGEEDELLQYFPEVAETFYRVKADVQAEYIKVLEVWAEHKDTANQKDFALAVKDRTPFASVLFNVRKKYGQAQTAAHLRQEWREAEGQIVKWLKA